MSAEQSANAEKPVRVALLSAAHLHAESYLACLQQLPAVQLCGVYDDDVARGQASAQRWHTPFYASLPELLADAPDAVIICAENVKHRPLVEAVAGKVRHILCEKPIATTLEDAQAMCDVCEAKGSHLHIAFPVRFSPVVKELQRIVDAGQLGRLISAVCTNHGKMPGGWFADAALAGGGAVMDHTVHVIDVLRSMLHCEVSEVYAEIGYGILHPDVSIDDAGMLSFSLSNGMYGSLDTSWSRPPSYPIWGDVKITLLGEEGIMRADVFRQSLSLSSERSGKTEQVGWGSNIDLALIKDFLRCVREDSAPTVSGYDGFKALEVALAAYRSAQSGQVVKLAADA